MPMKTLLLLRHAKSSWKLADQPDFERPLNGRGEKAAPLMGRHLREQKIEPDLVLCSPARRASQTAALFAEAAGLDCELRYDERIYEASAQQLLEVVAQADEGADVVLLVGHNPGCEELLLLLTGEPRLMPTAALAKITLAAEKWGKVKEQTGHLDWLVRPKDLEGEA
jgi:phosphohistidine phosphatase